jgi:hypothetical protein
LATLRKSSLPSADVPVFIVFQRANDVSLASLVTTVAQSSRPVPVTP